MSSKSVKAIKWLGGAFMGGAGAWSWAIWLGVGVAATAAALAWHSGKVSTAVDAAEKRGASSVQAQWDKSRVEVAEAVATAHRENARELSRLVQVNEEVQGAYNTILSSLATDVAGRAASAGLRDSERADIAAAAGRAAADTCGRFASISERNIAGIEADAESMGQRAVRATAVAEALKRTLLERRAALDAKREALKPNPTKE
ncbi:hypothetical protein ACVC7V_17580 [Hydrogenophaga sp. A37]|uniref:hypothetical protein n=1 Tax=Hydrogenophaga sp. A37 TaxID=1945864 RepID=UPI000984B95A|nr:hypothetical protein [Hydrogenophaga sp. A37]OOG79156.1 hypothetical protein B0E41_25360 [Hydrogenophaga sp. A37]